MSNEIKLDISPETAQGKYTNFAVISHTPNEFVFDFASVYPGQPNSNVVARVVTNPRHAKSFLRALAENIAKYEQVFGEITEASVAVAHSSTTN